MLTPFGREVRKLRIDKDMTLSKMAEGLEVSPAFLTAVETGKKSIPQDFPARIAKFLGAGADVINPLRQAAELSRNVHKIVMGQGNSMHDREVAALFARQFPDLSETAKKEIQKILEKEQGV